MAVAVNIIAVLGFVYGGTYSAELLLDRYATPQARAAATNEVFPIDPAETPPDEG